MQDLIIPHKFSSPKIEFAGNVLLIWGTCLPHYPEAFYQPLSDWIDEYSLSPQPETILELGIKFTRAGGMSYIQRLIEKILLIQSDKHNVTVVWYYSPRSIDRKAGEYLSRLLNLPFMFVKIQDDMWY